MLLPASAARSARRALELADHGRQQRVAAQVIVVDEILVAQRQGEHPLGDQARHAVLDPVRLAVVIGEAGGELAGQADRPVVAPSSSAPASEVIVPPSNPATTARPSTAWKLDRSALHSVGIGGSSA